MRVLCCLVGILVVLIAVLIPPSSAVDIVGAAKRYYNHCLDESLTKLEPMFKQTFTDAFYGQFK